MPLFASAVALVAMLYTWFAPALQNPLTPGHVSGLQFAGVWHGCSKSIAAADSVQFGEAIAGYGFSPHSYSATAANAQ
jgi:hypothetical protein